MSSIADRPYLLYADDDLDDLKLFKDTIREVQPDVVLFEEKNGRKAIEFLESIPFGERLPSAIILDWNMPELNGPQTLSKIKINPTYSKIPVLIFTTSNHVGQKEQALSNKADAFITKPFEYSKLIELCRMFAAFLENPALLKLQ